MPPTTFEPDNTEWWGMNSEHGWVVLDRTIPDNMSSNRDKLFFIKCADWSIYLEEWKHWDLPEYIYYPKVFRTVIT